MKFTVFLNKLTSIAIAVVIISVAQFGFVKSENIAAQAIQINNQDSEFKQLINNSLEAWNTNKPENLAQFYAQDPELKFYDALPMQYQGWNNYQTGIQQHLFDNMPKFTLTANDDIQSHRQDNLAWTTFTWHLSAELNNGTPIEADGRQTDIWEKRDGKWLIVHQHISSPISL